MDKLYSVLRKSHTPSMSSSQNLKLSIVCHLRNFLKKSSTICSLTKANKL